MPFVPLLPLVPLRATTTGVVQVPPATATAGVAVAKRNVLR